MKKTLIIKILFLFLFLVFCFLFLTSCIQEDAFFREENVNQTEKQKKQENSDIKFSFIVTSDNDSINNVYKEIIKQTNENNDVKFLINIGDITNGSSEYKFEEFKNFMDENMKKPYYVAIGDNDILEETGKDTFIKYFDKLYYSFDYENAHFIILDNAGYKERFSDEQLDWLKNDLEQNKNKGLEPLAVFIFMHRPINPPFAQLFNYDQEEEFKKKNQKFLDIIKDYKISEIYCGHIHTHMEYALDTGTPVTITGGAGSPFQLNDANSAYYHYMRVNVKRDGHTNEVVEIGKAP